MEKYLACFEERMFDRAAGDDVIILFDLESKLNRPEARDLIADRYGVANEVIDSILLSMDQ